MMEQTHEEDEHYVVKRNGQKEKISFDKILNRIKKLGQPKQLNVNYTGLVIPLLNEKLMAESIIKLIEKPYLIEKYGNNGYNTIIKNFSLNKMIKHHRNYFNSL